jgi:hypothetical protein
MKLFPLASVILAMLLVSCANYRSVTPSVLTDLPPGIIPGDVVRLSIKYGEIMRNLKVVGLDSGKIKVLRDQPDSKGQWTHFFQTIMINDIREIQKSSEPNLANGGILLAAENSITHEYYFFTPGQTLLYKIKSSRGFKKGRITGFTDSTISIQDREAVNAILLSSALAAIVIPGSRLRTTGGVALMTLGIATLGADAGFVILTSVFEGENKYVGETLGAGVFGLATLVGGVVLFHDKKIDLEKSWKLKKINLQDYQVSTPTK